MQIEGASSCPSFWQSTFWKFILSESNQASQVSVYSYGAEAIQYEIRSLGLGYFGAFSLGVDMNLYSEEFIEKCKKQLRHMGVIFWQIEEYHPEGIPKSSAMCKTYGKSFLEPWTRVIDLTLSEEEILATMHEKGRYNIRLAWKRGVEAKWVEPTSENIDIWMNLLAETTKRDDFFQNSRSYYTSFLRSIRDGNIGGILFAYLEGQVIAAGIFVYYHSVGIYYYGASSSDLELRKNMAPYLIQWVAIQEAKSRGCTTYDFLGISPPGREGHPLEGVSIFKERFGGQAREIGSKNIYVLGYIRYILFRFFRFLKNKISSLGA